MADSIVKYEDGMSEPNEWLQRDIEEAIQVNTAVCLADGTPLYHYGKLVPSQPPIGLHPTPGGVVV